MTNKQNTTKAREHETPKPKGTVEKPAIEDARKGKDGRDLSYMTDAWRANQAKKAREQAARTTKEQREQSTKKRKETLGWKGWSYKYECCEECGYTRFKHAAKGICTSCYQKRRKQIARDKELKRYTEKGLFYGERGKITYDKEGHKLQCHICGKFYETLALHISQWHLVELDWYKAQFGLKRTFGLATEQFKEQQRRTAKKTREKYGVSENFYKAARKVKRGSHGGRLQFRLEKSAALKKHHWMDDNPEGKKKWREKVNKSLKKEVHSHCASCFKPIVTKAAAKSDTYCKECRRLAYNASQRRYRKRRKAGIVGVASTQLAQENAQKLERRDKRCKICGELMCTEHEGKN